MSYEDLSFEKITDRLSVCVSAEHRFGTDAFLLADFAGAKHKDTAIDLCSGNGIVAVLLEKFYSPKQIFAVELQDKAYFQLKETARASELSKLVAVHGDLKEYKAPCEVDLITCNPPYKISGTGIESSANADKIARHEIMCTVNDVCKTAARNLKFGGRLCICNRPERLCDVLCAMRENGIEPKRVRFVSKRAGFEPWLFLCEGRKGGNPFLRVEKELYVYGENGEYSDEMKRIYQI